MFSHVMIGTNDIEESRAFYDKLFEALGSSPGKLYPNLTGQKRYFYNFNGSSFVISEPIDGNAATVANGSTIGFNIENIYMSDSFLQQLERQNNLFDIAMKDYKRLYINNSLNFANNSSNHIYFI